MRRLALIILLAFVHQLSIAQSLFKTDQDISVGAKQTDDYLEQLKGKNVAVVGNHTSMVDSLHLVDFLLAQGVDIKKVFAPEHGFRGKADAGEKVDSGIDSKTGLPITSLYGSHKKPTPEDLEGIDVVIFDIQDVGARFYTYISTMAYVMEACAENKVAVIVFDRPNPNGFYVDGPMLDPEYKSFVGMLPIPVVHGLTVGELAQMINGEAWLENGVKCDLTVVPCEGYHHKDVYVLPVKPSPNLPNQNAILLYPSLCFFEGTSISVGRGTDHPFEVFGHPNMTTGSHVFVPKPNDGSKHPKHEGLPCIGWDLTEFGGKNVQEKRRLILDYMVNAYREFHDKESFFLSNGFINKLAGTDELQKQIEAGMSADEIRATWRSDLATYMNMRRQYLLYPDFQ
ncbi:DUF1343 domain-containing protein [Salibacteraceae bacterium]|nr:DUF1343 domain-containing protein [Salibacteraceae bacterium]